MSLINDALKRVRQASSSEAPAAVSQPSAPMQPVTHHSVPVAGWLIPAAVIFLIISGVFFVGFAMARHSVKKASPAEPSATAASSAPVQVASAAPKPVAAVAPQPNQQATTTTAVPKPSPAPATSTVATPKLQGIFYSPTAPTAIVDGKTVRVGDHFSQYRVVEITRLTVTLVGADGKSVKLSMDN